LNHLEIKAEESAWRHRNTKVRNGKRSEKMWPKQLKGACSFQAISDAMQPCSDNNNIAKKLDLDNRILKNSAFVFGSM